MPNLPPAPPLRITASICHIGSVTLSVAGSRPFPYGPPAVGPDGRTIPGHVYRCADGWHMGTAEVAAGPETPDQASPCVMSTPGFPSYQALLLDVEGAADLAAWTSDRLTNASR